MIRRAVICAALCLGLAGPATAAVRELDASEIRSVVNAGGGQSLAVVLKSVSRSYNGNPVDVRAFDADGLVYAIMLVDDAGKVSMIVIDAVSNQVLNPRSSRAQEVLTAVKNNPGKGHGKAKGKGKGKGKSKGKSKGKGRN